MRHPFRKSARQGPVDPERLKGFEKQLGAKLPEPYRAFLLEHNGCDFGSKETPTTFFGLHGRKHTSIDGPTYPNRNFLPPEVLVIGHDYGDTPWLIGVAGPHRGEAFRARGGSDWESADEGGDVWENVSVVAPGLPALLDLITAEAALEEGDAKAFDAYLAEGHGVDEPIFGRTPLDVALGSGQLDLARALLGRGADVSKVDDTLFRDIGATGSVEALLLYADALGDINRVITYEDWTLLDLAVWQQHVEAARALLARGATPNAETFRLAGKSDKQIRELLKPYKR